MEDELLCVDLLPSIETLAAVSDSLPVCRTITTKDVPLRPLYDSGKCARIALRSLVI
jgi:hypothetical protein